MKRFLTSALVLALFAPVALVGCGDTEKAKTETTIEGPGGKTKITEETRTDKSGSNPPAVPGAVK